MSLHVLATFIARPEAVDEVRPLLLSLVEPIRRDPGCTRCHLVVNSTDPAETRFVEEWTSEAGLDRHLADGFVAQGSKFGIEDYLEIKCPSLGP